MSFQECCRDRSGYSVIKKCGNDLVLVFPVCKQQYFFDLRIVPHSHCQSSFRHILLFFKNLEFAFIVLSLRPVMCVTAQRLLSGQFYVVCLLFYDKKHHTTKKCGAILFFMKKSFLYFVVTKKIYIYFDFVGIKSIALQNSRRFACKNPYVHIRNLLTHRLFRHIRLLQSLQKKLWCFSLGLQSFLAKQIM